MISAAISRLVILVCGTLYPAYRSYKAVRTKNVKEYVKWMMYWIVFALFTCAETFTDIFLSFWFPFYYELKILVVLWLLSPATKGSSILYRKFVHQQLAKHEKEIDNYLDRAKNQGYDAVMRIGTRGFNYASHMVVQTAIKSGGHIMSSLQRSYSLSDLEPQSKDIPAKRLRLDSAVSADMDQSVEKGIWTLVLVIVALRILVPATLLVKIQNLPFPKAARSHGHGVDLSREQPLQLPTYLVLRKDPYILRSVPTLHSRARQGVPLVVRIPQSAECIFCNHHMQAAVDGLQNNMELALQSQGKLQLVED